MNSVVLRVAATSWRTNGAELIETAWGKNKNNCRCERGEKRAPYLSSRVNIYTACFEPQSRKGCDAKCMEKRMDHTRRQPRHSAAEVLARLEYGITTLSAPYLAFSSP